MIRARAERSNRPSRQCPPPGAASRTSSIAAIATASRRLPRRLTGWSRIGLRIVFDQSVRGVGRAGEVLRRGDRDVIVMTTDDR